MSKQTAQILPIRQTPTVYPNPRGKNKDHLRFKQRFVARQILLPERDAQ